MDLRDCHEVACSTDLQALENRLVRFANQLDFGLITGALILESADTPVKNLPFGNVPEAYRSISESVERGRRDPVMQLLKRSRVPFSYDKATYVEAGAIDIWDVQAQYGFKTGIATTLCLGPCSYLIIGVDRDDPLPGSSSHRTRMFADLLLFAAHVQAAVLRLLGPSTQRPVELPHLTPREQDILRWSGDGKSAWVVGQIIHTSEHNVNYHLRRIMTKLSAGSKHQAVAKARALGLL